MFHPHCIDIVILCGGNITVKHNNREKLQCMLNIERRPFLSYIIDQISAFSFSNVIFAVDDNNSAELRNHFEDRYAFVDFKYSYEYFPLGTIGAAKKAAIEFGKSNHLLLIKGNTYTNFDIFDLRNFLRSFRGNLCSLAYKDPDKLIRIINKKIEEKKYYDSGIYLIDRTHLLSFPDIYNIKDIEDMYYYILNREKNKTIDMNIVKNNYKKAKIFFRDIWGYDWSRYEYFDDGVKECLYCNYSHRIITGKNKYHGWKMKCCLKNKFVERRSKCDDFVPKGDKPYCRIPPKEEDI